MQHTKDNNKSQTYTKSTASHVEVCTKCQQHKPLSDKSHKFTSETNRHQGSNAPSLGSELMGKERQDLLTD